MAAVRALAGLCGRLNQSWHSALLPVQSLSNESSVSSVPAQRYNKLMSSRLLQSVFARNKVVVMDRKNGKRSSSVNSKAWGTGIVMNASQVLEEALPCSLQEATTVDVQLGDRSYPIYIGSGLLNNPDLLQK